MRIRDVKNSDPGSKIEKSQIQDKHPRSATLLYLAYEFSGIFTTVLPPHPVPNYALLTDKTLQYV